MVFLFRVCGADGCFAGEVAGADEVLVVEDVGPAVACGVPNGDTGWWLWGGAAEFPYPDEDSGDAGEQDDDVHGVAANAIPAYIPQMARPWGSASSASLTLIPAARRSARSYAS